MKQLSCKREQKWLIRSFRQIKSSAGGFPSHVRTNNSYLPLIGRVQLQLALANRCRIFHALAVALKRSGGVNEELAGDRQYGHQHPPSAVSQLHQQGAAQKAASMQEPNRFHANEQTSVAIVMRASQGVLAHGELRNVEGSDREYLISTSCHWFRFQNTHIPGMKRRLLQPQSQMASTGKLKLCHKATPLACSLCFLQHTPQEMFLRYHYIRTILESCAALVSPSQLLIVSYHPNFVMIGNGLPATFDESKREGYFQSYSAELNRFGYFGQLNRYKGVLVLLQAVALLQEQGVTNFIVNINGANLEHQPQDFQVDFNDLYEKVKDRVMLRGSYLQQDIEALMLENDWVVVPSIWWKNSPMVIQEAFFYGRPVLGSNIGGTAEKVQKRVGKSFAVSNPSGLSALIHDCTNNFITAFSDPITSDDCQEMHTELYGAFSTAMASTKAMTIKMIVHIGTGKTGSTAIQKQLRALRKELGEQGYHYWGLNLEYAPTSNKREWQKPGGISFLQRMNTRNCISELTQSLEEALANTPDSATIIWSNESIYEMDAVFQPVLQSLKAKNRLRLQIFAYARNLPSFILSAYKQWGIKHKTNRGAIQPFSTWLQQKKNFLAYPTFLDSWDRAFPDELCVFNYDSINDVVPHFVTQSGLPTHATPTKELEREYSTPEDIFLAVYALYNNRFADSVLPSRISELLSDNQLLQSNFVLPPLSSLYPTIDDLEEQSSFIGEQTDLINIILARHNQQPLSLDLNEVSTSPPEESRLVNGILSILLALIVEQDNRIKSLEQCITSKSPTMKPSPAP